MRCVIFANGDVKKYNRLEKYLTGDEYIICADGGTRHAVALKLIPHLIIGDLDSTEPELLIQFSEKKSIIKKFPAEKDAVDTELAINEAIALNAEEIILIGAVGSRLDHTLANIHLLVNPVIRGIKASIVSDNHHISLITPECPAVIFGNPGDLLSLLPMTQKVQGVVSKGLKWNLTDSTFEVGYPYGISNVLLRSEAEIKIKDGVMILIKVYGEV